MTLTMPSALPDPDYDHAYYDGVPAKRLFAWIIDVILISAMTLILGLLTLTVLLWIWPIVYFAMAFVYRWATIASGSATLGMRLMNIELRGPTGARFSTGEAALHTLAYLVCSGFGILQLISIVMMGFGSRHQGLHDLLIGSVAINPPL